MLLVCINNMDPVYAGTMDNKVTTDENAKDLILDEVLDHETGTLQKENVPTGITT